MGRRWLRIVILVVAVGVTVVVAAVSRGGDKAPKPSKPYTPPAASKQFGDDADLMRRLERKKLLQRSSTTTSR